MSKHLTGSREEFEAWIRDTIGGHFRWKMSKSRADLMVDCLLDLQAILPTWKRRPSSAWMD